MAVITVSGEPGCRTREIARMVAHRLAFEHISAERLDSMLQDDFGSAPQEQERAWPAMAASLLYRYATEAHLVIGVDGAELLFPNMPGLLRIRIVAPAARRAGNLMVDDRLDRATARTHLKQREEQLKHLRKRRFGRATPSPASFDLTLNGETLEPTHMADLISAAAEVRSFQTLGFYSRSAEAQQQFHLRLQLSKFGIQPKHSTPLKRTQFVHPSEEIFANLLDFYQIPWEYEPRSFPIAWDENGKVLESFTPDFYLPESNLYVELTTMKQSLVTKKNRKIRLLREIYPNIQIQVFYQKDLQDLVAKYDLSMQQPVTVNPS